MMLLLRRIVLVDLIIVIVESQRTAVINTTLGPIQGEILTTVLNSVKYAAFKGIPYAEPPVGYRRFKPPIPVNPWTDVLNATVEGPCCVQIAWNRVIGSEDCLFLNVFTTVTDLETIPKKLKSVIVYIYGGAWVTGSSSTEMYGPDYLLERDIVFVSFNYRGGAFGFMSLNHPNATGNAGLKDQNLVLKWVQANVKKFGGNPQNVTIMGGSSGAMSVGYHVISDASVGLFHAAISTSGTPLIPWAFQTLRRALSHSRILSSLLGTDSTDKEVLLKTFYEASAVDLARATSLVGRIISFTPTLEDPSIATDIFLSKCSILKYYTGNFSKVPQMIGYMEEETVTFTYCRKKEMKPYLQTITYVMDLADYLGMDMPESLPLVLDTFDSWNYDELGDFEYAIISETVKEMSDFIFISQIDLTQRILAAYNGDEPVYYFHITFDMERSPHNLIRNCTLPGAGHGDELAYLFYAWNANYTLDPATPMRITIHRITTMFTNFAKYGHPTPDWVDEYPLNVAWPNSGPKGFSLEIGNTLKVGSRPTNNNQNLIESFYWVLLPKINGCV